MTDYKDYGTFYDTLMSKYDELESLAREKLEEEKWSLNQLPFLGVDGVADADSGDFEDTFDKLNGFAADRCSADYQAFDTMLANLDAAALTINGETTADAVTTGGVHSMVLDIDDGLDSWVSETADVFSANFVATIGNRATKQVESITRAKGGLVDSQLILLETRSFTIKLVEQTITSLNEYSPKWDNMIVLADLVLNIVSFVPIGGAVRGAATGFLLATAGKSLPKVSGLSVQGILSELRGGIDALKEEVVAGEDYLVEEYNKFLEDEKSNWYEYVCNKPVEPVPAYHHG